MNRTRLIVTSIIITLGIYDAAVVSYGGVDWSVSQYFHALASYPVVPFVMGYLCGHFFGFMEPTVPAGDRYKLK